MTLLAGPARADDSLLMFGMRGTGSDFLTVCGGALSDQAGGESTRLACWSYFGGAVAALVQSGAICPAGAGLPAMGAAVAQTIEAQPSLLGMPASRALVRALAQHYPCRG